MKQADSYVVIKINNAQYRVSEGQTIDIQKVDGKAGDKLSFDQVLLKVDGEKVTVGTPVVAKSSIDAEIIDQVKGEKVRTYIYKAKSRYHKRRGHRQQLTRIKINKIN